MDYGIDLYDHGEKVMGTVDDATNIGCNVSGIADKNVNSALNNLNNSLTNLIKYAEKSFTFSFDAGAIGTRATQLAANISEFGITNINNIISAYITSLGSSQQVVPNILISPVTNGVYINCYRATAIAVTNMTLTVRVIYKTK